MIHSPDPITADHDPGNDVRKCWTRQVEVETITISGCPSQRDAPNAYCPCADWRRIPWYIIGSDFVGRRVVADVTECQRLLEAIEESIRKTEEDGIPFEYPMLGPEFPGCGDIERARKIAERMKGRWL